MAGNVPDVDGSPASVNTVLEELWDRIRTQGPSSGVGGKTLSYPVELGSVKSNTSAPANSDKRTVLAEHWGRSGTLKQVWIAGSGANNTAASFMEDGGKILIYVDDTVTPVVNMTIAEFFAYKFRAGVYSNQKIGRTSREDGGRSSGYRYLEMEFSDYIRVEVLNTTTTDASAFFGTAIINLDREKRDAKSLQRKISSINVQAAKFERVTVLDVNGAGSVEAIQLAMSSATADDYGMLEGNFEIFVDGETWPSWRSSGAEDAFNGGWYQLPVGGYPAGIGGPSDQPGTSRQLYRFFDNDKIWFNSRIKVVALVGQRGQGNIAAATIAVQASVEYRLGVGVGGTWPKLGPVRVTEEFTSAIAANWNVPGDKTPFTVSGGKLVSTWGGTDAFRDMRITRKTAPPTAKFFISSRVRITNATKDDQSVAVFAKGAPIDSYYGSALHVQLVRQTQYDWVVRASDDFNIVGVAKIDSGLDLTNVWVELAIRLEGQRATAYYRMDGQEFYNPIVSWDSSKVETGWGVMTWTAGAEIENCILTEVQ